MKRLLVSILLLVVLLLPGCAGDPLADIFMSNIYPGGTDTYDIGSTTYRWDEGYFRIVHADNITGNITESDPVFTASDAFPITAAEIASWNAHPPLTTGVHGVGAGSVVGTTLAQELTGPKTLTNAVGKGTWTTDGVWKLPAMFFNGDVTTDRWTALEGNTFFGTRVAGAGDLAGNHNTFIGHHTGNFISSGDYNCAWGSHALFNITTGNGNVGVGYQTGGEITTGSYNVMIGGSAGPTTNATNYGLFIDISETDTPLIGGNFTQGWVAIYDNLGIGVQNPSAKIHLSAGTATVGTAPLKMTSGTLLTTPEAGVLEYDGTGIYLTNTNHRRFISQAADSIIDSVIVSDTAAETTVFTGTINANELKTHRVYRLSYYGHMDTASAADTVTIRVHINGTTLVTRTSAIGIVTDSPFHGETVFTVRTTGAMGTISAYGEAEVGASVAQANASSIVVNTTNINYVTLTFDWDVAKVDNIMTLDQAFIEVLD